MRQLDKLPKSLADEFLCFLQTHPPQEFNNSMRHVFMEYVEYAVSNGFPNFFETLAYSLSDLFKLLDKAIEKMNKPVKEKKLKKLKVEGVGQKVWRGVRKRFYYPVFLNLKTKKLKITQMHRA
jgi:hypothetical protein